MKTIILISAALVLAVGCGDESDDTIDFPTGNFVVQTLVVDDQCLDGGLNLLFMPNGAATAWEWPLPVKLYAEDELPTTYTIALREPFGEMEVTANDAGPDQLQIQSEVNKGVKLGASTFGECVADMKATVDFRIDSTDSLTGLAALEMSDPRGDENCPVDMPPRCDVFLSIQAERQ